MNDYFQNDITVGLDLETHKAILHKTFGENISNGDYDTRLIYNQRNPEYLQLSIYYEPSDHLFEKFELLRESGIDILNTIKQKSQKFKWEFSEAYDFSQSTLIDIKESHYWEHNKKPVILTIDNLDILAYGRYGGGDGRFKLTKNVFHHLDEYVQYGSLGRNRFDNRFIDKNYNRETSFGPVNFVLSFEHFYGPSESIQNINILRDAYITITDKSEKLTDKDLIQLAKSICLLMSFYWEKPIEFFTAQVRINDSENYRTREILKFSNHEFIESLDFLLKEKFSTFYEFIGYVDFERFEENSEILNELIPRILKTKSIDDISTFMILYNIIEKIRNYFLSKPLKKKPFSIKEEFDFTLGKKKTNEFIKSKIKEIGEIVKESDSKGFDKKASDKVSFIRKTGLKDQFDSLLTYLDLDPKSYDIDFIDLIRIRNNIYHGKLPNEDIRPYIQQMRILIYDMILKTIIY